MILIDKYFSYTLWDMFCTSIYEMIHCGLSTKEGIELFGKDFFLYSKLKELCTCIYL